MPKQAPKFLRPIESNVLTQKFGENGVCAQISSNGLTPVRPFVLVNKDANVCPAGYKDFYKLLNMLGHNGGDWAAWLGEPVYHCGTYSGWQRISTDTSGALNVDVVSSVPVMSCIYDCPPGTIHYIYTRYSHGSRAIGFNGKQINPGDAIMGAGKSGGVTGVHVHWAPKYCDAAGNGLHTTNGYEGALNYNPYFQNIFILDYLKQQVITPPPVPVIKPEDPPQPIPVPPPVPARLDLSWIDLLRKVIFGIVSILYTPKIPH